MGTGQGDIDGSAGARSSAKENEFLVVAIAAGKREAERDFVLRYQGPVRAMLLARSRNPDLSADLQQEVMIEAICALRRGQLRDPERLSGFVLGIARNLLNNHLRSSYRTQALDLPDDLPDLRANTEQMEERQWEQTALQAIETLDGVDRAILQMTLVDGMKPAAIATQLRLNPDVVRQRKLRATRRITEMVRAASQKRPPGHNETGRSDTGRNDTGRAK